MLHAFLTCLEATTPVHYFESCYVILGKSGDGYSNCRYLAINRFPLSPSLKPRQHSLLTFTYPSPSHRSPLHLHLYCPALKKSSETETCAMHITKRPSYQDDGSRTALHRGNLGIQLLLNFPHQLLNPLSICDRYTRQCRSFARIQNPFRSSFKRTSTRALLGCSPP
jgi:hypothetical protein